MHDDVPPIDPSQVANVDLEEEERLEALKLDLDSLRTEHRRLDQEIEALRLTGAVDMLKIQRLKKIKLKLKDRIAVLENQLTPDIIA